MSCAGQFNIHSIEARVSRNCNRSGFARHSPLVLDSVFIPSTGWRFVSPRFPVDVLTKQPLPADGGSLRSAPGKARASPTRRRNAPREGPKRKKPLLMVWRLEKVWQLQASRDSKRQPIKSGFVCCGNCTLTLACQDQTLASRRGDITCKELGSQLLFGCANTTALPGTVSGQFSTNPALAGGFRFSKHFPQNNQDT